MSPSKKCKEAGLSSLAELSEISTVSVNTLHNWFKHKPVVFETVLRGSITIKRSNEIDNLLDNLIENGVKQ